MFSISWRKINNKFKEVQICRRRWRINVYLCIQPHSLKNSTIFTRVSCAQCNHFNWFYFFISPIFCFVLKFWYKSRKWLRQTYIEMVLFPRSLLLFYVSNIWWTWWKVSKENWFIFPTWSAFRSWMRCFFNWTLNACPSKMLVSRR